MKKIVHNNHHIICDDNIFFRIKEMLVQKIKEELQEKEFFSIALSGGKTPGRLYNLLAEEKLPWNRVKVFLVDERILPCKSEGLNSEMIKDAFLSRPGLKPLIFIPEDFFSFPQRTAAEMEKVLKEQLPLNKSGIPVIDLILLGIGSDGHTASIFPGKKAFYEKEKLVMLTEGPSPYKERITFTFPLIKSAKERWFLISGTEKRDILKKIFTEEENFPAKIVSLFIPSLWFLQTESLPELEY